MNSEIDKESLLTYYRPSPVSIYQIIKQVCDLYKIIICWKSQLFFIHFYYFHLFVFLLHLSVCKIVDCFLFGHHQLLLLSVAITYLLFLLCAKKIDFVLFILNVLLGPVTCSIYVSKLFVIILKYFYVWFISPGLVLLFFYQNNLERLIGRDVNNNK